MSNQQNTQSADAQIQALLEESKQTGVLSGARMDSLLNAFLLKEARLAEKEAALEVAIQARDAQRKIESENFTIAKIENQRRCKHLKGGKSRTRGQQRDPNVYAHIFTNGTKVIKCNGCGARWLPGDTDEYLTRNGSKLPNWTNIGFRKAQEMCEDSSNKPSSSEIFPTGYVDTSKEATAERRQQVSIPNLQL